MIEAKIILPYFDPDGKELGEEHKELRDRLINAYGLLHRVKLETLYKSIEKGNICCDTSFQYTISCDDKDFSKFMDIAREFGYRCRQKIVFISMGRAVTKQIDLANIKDDKNWQALANERFRERQKQNAPWPTK